MGNARVKLSNFWPDGYPGHTDSYGRDLGKAFLRSLFEKNSNSRNTNIVSHFPKVTSFSILADSKKKISALLNRDQLTTSRKLHGHTIHDYEIDKKELNVWYTSENLRPPLGEQFDLFLSHDLDGYDGRNIYLPIWATRLGVNVHESSELQTTLAFRRNTTLKSKSGICAVISNPEPIRMAFLNELQRYFKVDIYGAFGLPLTDKAKVLSRYKINICFENDEYPGYVTEKPFEAWSNECVPVWRGLDSGAYINDEAIVNVTNLGFQESIKRIESILKSDDEYLRISGLPILRKEYDFNKLETKVNQLFYS